MKGSAISSAAQPNSRRGAAFDPRPFIRANLPLRAVPDVPELLIHSATPASGLSRLAEEDPLGFGSPYWAYPWAGGIALARYVLDHPERVKGRSLLDLGTGSGLVAIAAAKAGARAAQAADVDRYALAALDLNASANGVAIAARLGDLTAGPPPATDMILVGDLFYTRDLADRVTAFLDRCVAAGIEVLVGDPRRASLPRERLRHLAEYRVRDVGDGQGTAPTAGAVFAFALRRPAIAAADLSGAGLVAAGLAAADSATAPR
jgi:predicted nicotinamide N-methyase